MADSLHEHDPSSVLWVLSLDAFTTDYLREINLKHIRIVELSTLEKADPALLATKPDRDPIEYYFTLSPCWPRYLFRQYPELEHLTYVDADMFFFASPAPIFAEMKRASVLVTEHRYPNHLSHLERCGLFNVGLLSFRNNPIALACLNQWRENCLAWCHDRAEEGKYADQKYLDEWPDRLGQDLHVVRRLGVNLAPWNWSQYRYSFEKDRVWVQDDPLEMFHFARFRPSFGNLWFQSGQLEYGVMPWKLRQRIYGPYWRALKQAFVQIRRWRPEYMMPRSSLRCWHSFWRALVPRVLFGSDWLRIGSVFISGRFGLGRYSGQMLSFIRRVTTGEPETPEKAPEALTTVSAE